MNLHFTFVLDDKSEKPLDIPVLPQKREVLRDRVPAFQCLPVDALTSELDLTHKLEEFNEAPLPSGGVSSHQLCL